MSREVDRQPSRRPWAAALLTDPPRQPDGVSCAVACTVLARALADEEYADRLLAASGGDRVGERVFAAEVQAIQGVRSGPRDAAGRLRLPWPRALGTPPWELAGLLRSATGVRYLARPTSLGRVRLADGVEAAVAAGHPVPWYVGNRWAPRHVVLVLGVTGPLWTVYEPSAGRVLSVSRAAFTLGPRRVAGWDWSWFVLLPTR